VVKDLLPGDPVAVGPYKLLARLGRGGMGQVYLGRSPGGRRVAVKVIRPEYAEEPGFRARFTREVAAARGVSGMFTALVVDADTDSDDPWLATAYVAGPSLAEAVEDGGPLPVRTLFGLAAGLAEALEAIHAAGVVHRDLKPSNVLLAVDGPRVIDFGISRAREAASLTTTGMIVGSPGFLSPEQAEGTVVGPPTDIFSLGGVLTYAATGEGPFGTGPTSALLYRVVNREPELSAVPAEIRPLIERCLAKNPAARPTPAELLAELEESGVDVGVATPEWLPASVAGTFGRYVPTIESPETPADGAKPPVFDEPVFDEPVFDEPVRDEPVSDELAPAEPAAPAAKAPVVEPSPGSAAERDESSASGELSTVGLAAVPVAARTTGGAPARGGSLTAGNGSLAPPSRPRRRRLIVAAAVAVVVLAGLGAGFGLSGGSGPGKPIGRPTPSIEVSAISPAATSTPTRRASVAAVASHKPAKAKSTKSPKPGATHHTTAPATPGTTPAQNQGGAPTQGAPTTSAPATTAPSSPTPKPTPTHTTSPSQQVSGYSGVTVYPCSDEGGIGSTPGGSGVSFSFTNSSAADVSVIELEPGGGGGPSATVSPGGSASPGVLTDQVWLVQSATGGCLGIYGITGNGEVSVS
jgi:eukaryotic-like serine/threonine-protein kinase